MLGNQLKLLLNKPIEIWIYQKEHKKHDGDFFIDVVRDRKEQSEVKKPQF